MCTALSSAVVGTTDPFNVQIDQPFSMMEKSFAIPMALIRGCCSP